MKVAFISANLGNYESITVSVPQTVLEDIELSYYLYTNKNFPPRSKTMAPRLQAKIPKMFAWQMVPGHDVYIWTDAQFTMLRGDSIMWLINQLEDYDIAIFKHPFRDTVAKECDFLRDNMPISNRLMERYTGELLDEQMNVCISDLKQDNVLYASGIFIYRNNPQVQSLMKEWWYYTTRYHNLDQLSLPLAIQESGCKAKSINEDYYHCKYFTLMRGK